MPNLNDADPNHEGDEPPKKNSSASRHSSRVNPQPIRSKTAISQGSQKKGPDIKPKMVELQRAAALFFLYVLAMSFAYGTSVPSLALGCLVVTLILELIYISRGLPHFIDNIRSGSLAGSCAIRDVRKVIRQDKAVWVFLAWSILCLITGVCLSSYENKRWSMYTAEDGPPVGKWWDWCAGPFNQTNWGDTHDQCNATTTHDECYHRMHQCVERSHAVEGAHWLIMSVGIHTPLAILYPLISYLTAKEMDTWFTISPCFLLTFVGVSACYPSDFIHQGIAMGPLWPGDGPGAHPGADERTKEYLALNEAVFLILQLCLIPAVTGCCCAGNCLCPMKKYNFATSEWKKEADAKALAKDAIEDIDRFLSDHKEGAGMIVKQFFPPSKLPGFEHKHLWKILAEPDKYLLQLDDDTFLLVISKAWDYISRYGEIARQWNRELLQETAKGLSVGKTEDGDGMAESFAQAYRAIHKVLKMKDAVAYSAYVATVVKYSDPDKLTEYPNSHPKTLDKLPLPERMLGLYRSGHKLRKYFLRHLLEKIKVGEKIMADLKGGFRVLEKELLRPKGEVPWDIVRAQVKCDTMTEIKEVLETICEDPEVAVIHINDRFSKSKNGWADCAVYVTNTHKEYRFVIAEIQIVHNDLMFVREEMGAHDAYDECRFAAEFLMKEFGEISLTAPHECPICQTECAKCRSTFDEWKASLPWSCQKEPENEPPTGSDTKRDVPKTSLVKVNPKSAKMSSVAPSE
eukprot:gnl/MRDRNA2_/MRDRNA2_130381_c0_seq1.p1 gnl/MRDRNA2_/MRDRNA2_130381_c0~~gnl/MRDRNA2_/MRDRNA2_130381_c0_seq1.p1  ORF type:complete len:743 (-),score=94.15 gnl/MRDRNA2_/MRDRNA2_130381_c0_seq1:140-2368(-)